MVENDIIIAEGFVGRECRQNSHNKCDENWRGLGFQVKCYCKCHVTDAKSDRREDSIHNGFGHKLGGNPN